MSLWLTLFIYACHPLLSALECLYLKYYVEHFEHMMVHQCIATYTIILVRNRKLIRNCSAMAFMYHMTLVVYTEYVFVYYSLLHVYTRSCTSIVVPEHTCKSISPTVQ